MEVNQLCDGIHGNINHSMWCVKKKQTTKNANIPEYIGKKTDCVASHFQMN